MSRSTLHQRTRKVVLVRLGNGAFDSWSCLIGNVQGCEHSVQRNWQHCMIPEAAFFGVRNNVVILRFYDCMGLFKGWLEAI